MSIKIYNSYSGTTTPVKLIEISDAAPVNLAFVNTTGVYNNFGSASSPSAITTTGTLNSTMKPLTYIASNVNAFTLQTEILSTGASPSGIRFSVGLEFNSDIYWLHHQIYRSDSFTRLIWQYIPAEGEGDVEILKEKYYNLSFGYLSGINIMNSSSGDDVFKLGYYEYNDGSGLLPTHLQNAQVDYSGNYPKLCIQSTLIPGYNFTDQLRYTIKYKTWTNAVG